MINHVHLKIGKIWVKSWIYYHKALHYSISARSEVELRN